MTDIARHHDLTPENRATAERATCVGVADPAVAADQPPRLAYWVLNEIIDAARAEGRDAALAEVRGKVMAEIINKEVDADRREVGRIQKPHTGFMHNATLKPGVVHVGVLLTEEQANRMGYSRTPQELQDRMPR